MSRTCKCRSIEVDPRSLSSVQGSKNIWEIGPKIGSGGNATVYYARQRGEKDFCYAYGKRNMSEDQIVALQESAILGITPALVDIISIIPGQFTFEIDFVSTAAERELKLPLSQSESKQMYTILEIMAQHGIDHGDTGHTGNWLKCGDHVYIIDFNFSDLIGPKRPVDHGILLDMIMDADPSLEKSVDELRAALESKSPQEQILISNLVKTIYGLHLPENNYLVQQAIALLGRYSWIMNPEIKSTIEENEEKRPTGFPQK